MEYLKPWSLLLNSELFHRLLALDCRYSSGPEIQESSYWRSYIYFFLCDD